MLRNMVTYFGAYVGTTLKNKKGQAMVEYGLILALIAIAVVVILGTTGNTLNDLFTDVEGNL